MLDNFIAILRERSIFNHLDYKYFEKNSEYFVPIKYTIDKYKIKSRFSGSNTAHLKIEVFLETNFIRISGSLRKWFYGQLSLKDFTLADLEDALKLLGTILNISFEDLKKFEFSTIEIGLNIPSKVDFSYFKNEIKGFKNSTYNHPVINKTSLTFSNKSFKLIVYDKVEEIKSKIKKKRLLKDIEEENFFDITTKMNYFRIEFKITKGKSRIHSRINIETIGDLLEQFKELFIFFWVNVNKLEFLSENKDVLVFAPKNKTIKEMNDYFMKVGMKSFGYESALELTNQLKNEHKRQERRFVKSTFASIQNENVIQIKAEFLKTVRKAVTFELYWNNWIRYCPVVFHS